NSPMTQSSTEPSAPTTRSRAASRGLAGRSAMRSGGRAKSKSSVRRRPSLRIGRHARGDDAVRIAHRLAALDLVDILHAGGHLAPHRVLPVEPVRLGKADEELAVPGIVVARARHRDGAAHMWLVGKLRLELLPGAASAGAVGAPGLRHEAVDDAVE